MEKNELIAPQTMIVFGGSAGSLDFIFEYLPLISLKNDTSLLIVVHRKSTPFTSLQKLLQNKSKYQVIEIEDKDPIEAMKIYICPADYHLLVEKDYQFSLDLSERIDFNRPSIDLTFTEIADLYRKNTIAVLLSGANNDGALGCIEVQKLGGITIVQNPEKSKVPYMPQAAIDLGAANHVFSDEEILAFINNL